MPQQALSNIEQIEASLWSDADQLRANANLPSGEYCMPVLDHLYQQLPTPSFSEEEKEAAARDADRHLWQRGAGDGIGTSNA